MSKHLTPSEFFHPLIQKYWYVLAFILIITIAAFLRLYKLGEVPAGMTWDEAAIGYNGYAVWRTRRDEWLVRLPVSFKSFGDYKAPLAIYVSGGFTYLFGLNIWAVRLPFALAGTVTVCGMMLIVEVFFRKAYPDKPRYYSQLLSLFAGIIVATSPWHLHFSRAGFESGLALSMVVVAVYFWQLGILQNYAQGWIEITNRIRLNLWNSLFLFLSGSLFIFSLYTYHSTKITVPLLLLSLVIIFFSETRKKIYESVVAIVLAAPLVYPLMTDLLYAKGAERLNQISIFSTQTGLVNQLQVVFQNFLQHLTPAFLLFGQTTTLRHGDGRWGVLFVTEAVLISISVVVLIYRYFTNKQNFQFLIFNFKFLIYSLSWIVVGLLPATIGVEVPHANRALLAYPGFVMLAVFGIHTIFHYIEDRKSAKDVQIIGVTLSSTDQINIGRIVLGMMILVHGLLFIDYRHDYFSRYYQDSGTDFFYGYTQAFEFAKEHEDAVDKILFTSQYGQPYIFALFVRQTNPIWYQGGSLIKYEFSDKITEADILREKTVIIATPDEIPVEKADQIITAPNGEVKFVLIKTDAHR